MYGSKKPLFCQPTVPSTKYENSLVEGDEEEDDLYEPPPCDLQSRVPPPVWRNQGNSSLYSDHSQGAPAPQARPPIGMGRQGGVTHGISNVGQRPVVSSRHVQTHPSVDRRMSLPCTDLHTKSPRVSEKPRGMDDTYVTFGSSQTISQDNHVPGRSKKSSENSEDPGVQGKPWYVGELERKEAEKALRKLNKDGCFLVRLSSANRQFQPYTLAVLHKEHIYNIPIRALGASGYSLGKEGKQHEQIFPSVAHLIAHYKMELLHLVNSQTHRRESITLLYPAQS